MKLLKAIWNLLSTVLIVFLTLIAVFNLVCYVKRHTTGDVCPTFLGWGMAVVVSGSMEPEIGVDDLVLIVETNDYAVRDVVVYAGNTYPVTHRIVSMRTDGDGNTWVTTRGDANNIDDQEIPIERIGGEVVLTVRRVGKVQTFLQSPIGMLVLILVAIALIASVEITEILRCKRQRHTRGQ